MSSSCLAPSPAARYQSTADARVGGDGRRCDFGDTIVSPNGRIPVAATTTFKLPPDLRARVDRLAGATGRSAHGLMVQAIEREVAREERLQAFVEEALEADRAIEAGGEVYAAEDVHGWIEGLAQGKRPARPKPWRRSSTHRAQSNTLNAPWSSSQLKSRRRRRLPQRPTRGRSECSSSTRWSGGVSTASFAS